MCHTRADLLDEIWSQIFSRLPLEARKNVRLTCHRFYKTCNSIRLLQCEQLVLNGNLNASNPLQQLASSRRKLWNIKLNRVQVTPAFYSFFQHQGAKIRSLVLHKCRFTPGSLRTILEHCKNIRSFCLVLSYGDEDQLYQVIFDDFKALQNGSFICNVTDLTLKIHRNGCLSNRIFLQIFSLFPNVEQLDLEFEVGEKFSQLSKICGHVMSNAHFDFSCIYDQILVMRNQLEKLRLHFSVNRPPAGLSIQTLNMITEIEMKNLKQLSLNWITSLTEFPTNPFLGFQSLTQFDCVFGNNSTTQVSPLLELLLSTITGLRSLTLRAFYFHLSQEAFEALVTSKLVALTIETVKAADFEMSSISTLASNYTLQHLFMDAEHRDLFVMFPTYFRSLQHIKFPEVHNGILRNIFKHQTNLRSLKLYNGNEYHDWYPNCPFIEYVTFQQYLYNADLSQYGRLRHLTHLDIVEDKLCLTNFLLAEFEFPNLRALSISVMLERQENERFWQIIRKMQQLEYLKLRVQFAMSTQQWLVLLQELSKLRHIYIQDRAKLFDSLEYHQFFEQRSSLQTVTHNSAKYFYDITTDTIGDTRDTFDPNHRRLHPFACEGIPHRYYYGNQCP